MVHSDYNKDDRYDKGAFNDKGSFKVNFKTSEVYVFSDEYDHVDKTSAESVNNKKAEEATAKKKNEEEAAIKKKTEEEAAIKKKAEEETAIKKKAEEEAQAAEEKEKAEAQRKVAEKEEAAKEEMDDLESLLFQREELVEEIMKLPSWMSTCWGRVAIITGVAGSFTVMLINPGTPVTGDFGGPMLEPQKLYNALVLSPEALQGMATKSTERWLQIFAPLRSLVRICHLDQAWLVGHTLAQFAALSLEDMKVLPSWDESGSVSFVDEFNRKLLWVSILGVKVALLVITTTGWHFVLIQLPQKSERSLRWATKLKKKIHRMAPQRIQNHVSGHDMVYTFLVYHATHHVFLYVLVDIAVANNLISENSGIDWEFWSIWLDWLLLVLNVTAVVKYTWHLGEPLPMSSVDIFSQIVPGLGPDIHLLKDWMFIALCFRTAHNAEGWCLR